MITTTFPDHADQTKPFPKLMRHKENGSIILFSSEGSGTVVHVGQTAHTPGTHFKCFTAGDYEDYNGPVTLQNK